MRRYLLSRVAQIIVTLFIILTVLFILVRAAPGDPISRMVDPNMTPEDSKRLIEQLGLEKPWLQQYLIYLKNAVQGNFGYSIHYGKPVIDIIKGRLFNTLLLFTIAVFLSALLGMSWGKIAAWRKGKGLDLSMTVGALVTHTLFVPWLGLLIIWIMGYKLGWFPINGMISAEVWLDPSAGFVQKGLDVMYHMVLPLGTLVVHQFGTYLLVMRNSMLGTLREDYILTARAKGVRERIIRNRHAAPNARLPVITAVGLGLAFSVVGGVLTETVFSWPGLGREFVSAVSTSDYPMVQGCFLLLATVVLFSNLVVDMLYAYFDPRIRY